MAWFGGKSSKNKSKQIKGLMAKNGKGMTVQQLDSRTFRVQFRTRISQQWIMISLSDDFPSSAPTLKTDNKYSHTLIDNNGYIVGLTDLIKWNSSYSDLGTVVQKCVHSFVASPPSIKQMQQQPMYQQQQQPQQQIMQQPGGGGPGSGPGGGPPGYQQFMNKQPPSYQQHLNKNVVNNNNNNNNNKKHVQEQSDFDFSQMKLSVNNSMIEEGLNKLNNKEMSDLNKENKLLIEYAYRIASPIREMRQDTQNAVLKIAQNNIEKQKKLTQKKSDVDKIRQEIDTLTQLYTNLKKRQNKVLQKYSKQRINKEFDTCIEKTEDECEALRDKFDEKEIPPVTFAKKYVKAKQKQHILKIKQEKYNKQYK